MENHIPVPKMPFLFASAFPLRIVESESLGWEIWTRYDEKGGTRKNFAVCVGIRLVHEAEHICQSLNEAFSKSLLAPADASKATDAELSALTETLWKLDAVQLAAVAGTALGLAEERRKPRRTVIPEDHWMLKHLPIA